MVPYWKVAVAKPTARGRKLSAPSRAADGASAKVQTLTPRLSASDSEPSTQAWLAAWLLVILYVFSFFGRQLISLMVDPIEKQLGLTEVQIGLLIGLAFTLLFTVGGIVFGWLVDTFPRKLIIFWGTIFWSLSCIGCGLATSFGWLFVARMGVGIGEATLLPAAYSFLSDTFPQRRLASALGIFSFGATFGIALSLGLGGYLLGLFTHSAGMQTPLGHLAPWQAAFVLAGVPGLVLAGSAFFLPEAPRHAPAGSKRVLKPILDLFRRHPALMAAQFFGFSMNSLMGYTIMAWGPAFMGRTYMWPAGRIGPALGLAFGVSGALATLGSGFVADKLWTRGIRSSHYILACFALLAAAPAGMIAFLGPTPWTFLGGIFVVYFASALSLNMGATSLQLLTPPALRGRLSGLYIFCTNIIGAGLGPLIVALITQNLFHDKAKVGLAMAIATPVSALGAAAILWSARHAYARAVAAGPSEPFRSGEASAALTEPA